MPIIMRHQSGDWSPSLNWPEDCPVQWGDSGIVLKKEGARKTAFFEAFPKDGSAGFIRGEGRTLDEAEQSAFDRWDKQHQCHVTGGHRWSRTRRYKDGRISTYTNGGCFCLKCDAFQTKMKPIVKLGKWKLPLELFELDALASGDARPHNDSQESQLFARRLELRAKLFGINIPNWRKPQYKKKRHLSEDDEYIQECEKAIIQYYVVQHEEYENNESSVGVMESFFQSLINSSLHKKAQEMGLLEPGTE